MNLLEYFGNFHPLIIHLPIGILVVFLILGLFIKKQNLLDSIYIIRILLFVSALSATGSSISGYILSNLDSYDLQLVSFHQWFGISLTILNWILYFKIEYLLKTSIGIYKASLGIVFVALIFTGHAGGSITHGTNFLNPPPANQWFSSNTVEQKKISINSTGFEAATIILEKKCFVCHGESKQKGELRLDSKNGLLAGGESGKLIAENASGSLLIKRLLLPLDDQEHMPPKEKKQLSEVEIAYLIWWVENGTDFEKSLNELQLPDSLNGILYKEEIEISDHTIPDGEVEPADEKILEELRSFDLIVAPLGANTNFLSVNFMNVLKENSSASLEKLVVLSPQLIWLNLDDQDLEIDSWQMINQLTNVRKISLRNSNINDELLPQLLPLDKLVYLNLVNTEVTVFGLQKLKNLKNLESLYLFETGIEESEVDSIQKIFPDAKIYAGKYLVPTLKSDTTVFTLKSLK